MKHTFKPVTLQVNFPELEKKWLRNWYSNGIIDKYLHRNDLSDKRFSFLDGPITANNPMGVHHAWGRTYKDLWQRFFNMRGYAGRFQNGFDCQGLWVEVEVEKELGIKNKRDIENIVPGNKKASIAKFVELCKERVRKYSAIQTEQSKRLGYIVDWNNSYYTMSDENNYMIWHFLKTCHEKGWIYKGRDSVPWCPRCETAISQHEMLTEDYKEVTHKAIYIEFPITDRDNEYLLVWTTTPWTIPANIAIAIDENLTYSLVEGTSGDRLWIVKDRVEAVFGNKYRKVLKTVKGTSLVGLRYAGPFDDLPAVAAVAKSNPKTFHTVIATDPLMLPVTTTEGTGLVHTAVSAGAEDFKLGKKYGLPMIPVISDNADYLPNLGFLSGKNAKKHPEIILDYLSQQDKAGKHRVFAIENFTHRYPACWRCKTELVWRVTDEWYIAMDVPEKSKDKTLREQMIEVAKQITWYPSFGLDRELDWLSNMHDWLISKKNRYWGLALPIYECLHCGWFDVIGSKEELVKRAVVGWKQFDGHSPHKPFIDEVKIKCEQCGKTISRVDDVGNVWLDAGIVPFSTYLDPKTKKLSYTTDRIYWKQWFPADFITESFPGQFKNWFYSMIAMSTVLENRSPYKTVLGYASMLAEDGRAMHKSLGNAIEFYEAADKIGVDVMRWMFVTHDPEQNLLFGYKKADETRRQFQLMVWNIYNFFITYALTDRYKPDQVIKASDNVLDRWILSRLNEAVQKITDYLSAYDAYHASNVISDFISDTSLWYIRRSRDRVGLSALDQKGKIYCHETLYTVLVTVSKLLEPFTPFLSEEIYTNLTAEESVHLAEWPEREKQLIDVQLMNEMTVARQIVELGHAERKKHAVKVRQPLRTISYKSDQKLPRDVERLVADELNVKKVIYDGKSESTSDPYQVSLDFVLDQELVREGKARELIREIQMLRKVKGCRMDEHVSVQLPQVYKTLPKEYLETVKSETLVTQFLWGQTLEILTGK